MIAALLLTLAFWLSILGSVWIGSVWIKKKLIDDEDAWKGEDEIERGRWR